jgi:hypothetical protein
MWVPEDLSLQMALCIPIDTVPRCAALGDASSHSFGLHLLNLKTQVVLSLEYQIRPSCMEVLVPLWGHGRHRNCGLEAAVLVCLG